MGPSGPIRLTRAVARKSRSLLLHRHRHQRRGRSRVGNHRRRPAPVGQSRDSRSRAPKTCTSGESSTSTAVRAESLPAADQPFRPSCRIRRAVLGSNPHRLPPRKFLLRAQWASQGGAWSDLAPYGSVSVAGMQDLGFQEHCKRDAERNWEPGC